MAEKARLRTQREPHSWSWATDRIFSFARQVLVAVTYVAGLVVLAYAHRGLEIVFGALFTGGGADAAGRVFLRILRAATWLGFGAAYAFLIFETAILFLPPQFQRALRQFVQWMFHR